MADIYNVELFVAGMIVGAILMYSIVDILTKEKENGSDEDR